VPLAIAVVAAVVFVVFSVYLTILSSILAKQKLPLCHHSEPVPGFAQLVQPCMYIIGDISNTLVVHAASWLKKNVLRIVI
jgi:hypothetical protein